MDGSKEIRLGRYRAVRRIFVRRFKFLPQIFVADKVLDSISNNIPDLCN